MTSKLCLWIARHWPLSSIGFSHPILLWFIGKGSDAYVTELYPDGLEESE